MNKIYKDVLFELKELIGTLPDNIPYFGATKEQFLNKLEFACDQLEKMGETRVYFRNYPLNSDYYYACFPLNCIALPFYVKRNENKKVLKFYHLKEELIFQTLKDEEAIDEELGMPILSKLANIPSYEIYFRKDERIGFYQSEEYLKYRKQCDQAVENIHADKTQIIFTAELINNWLWEHQMLFHDIKNEWNIKAYHNFLELYFYCTLFKDKQKYSDQAKEAVLSFDPSEKEKIMDWLNKYTRLYFCHLMGEEEQYEILDASQFILQDAYHSNWFYRGEEFYNMYRFTQLFNEYYEKALME